MRSLYKVELILEAAMQLLETRDIETLTTNAVAQKAGISIGTLYQYFGSKHALLDALVNRELDAMTGKIVQSLRHAKPETPGDRIRDVVRAVTASYGGRNRVHQLLMAYSSARNAQSGRLTPFYTVLLDIAAGGGLSDDDGDGGKCGENRPLTPAEAFVLIYAITGVLRTMAASANPPPQQEVEDALVKLVLGFTSRIPATRP